MVARGACVVAWGCVWLLGVRGCQGVCMVGGRVHGSQGGVHGCWGGECAWLPQGACVVAEGHVWLRGTCMVARGHAWFPGGHVWLLGGVRV